jgi:hypothetical protein
MATKNYPHWRREYPTLHAFRATKRRQVRELKRALEAVRDGCAYMPKGGAPVGELEKIVDAMVEACSVKNWGR